MEDVSLLWRDEARLPVIQRKEALGRQSCLIQGLSETNRGLQVELRVGKQPVLLGDSGRDRQVGDGWTAVGLERGSPSSLLTS